MKLKIGTFNIQHGRNHARYLHECVEYIDLDGVADIIREHGIAICGLNEVRCQTGDGYCNQAQVIADKLGYHCFFAPAIAIQNGTYGNAIVSQYPIRSARAIPIPSPTENRTGTYRYEDRVLLVAEVEIEHTVLTVLICHFGRNPEEQRVALDTIRTELSDMTEPTVLMGDFNLPPHSEYYSPLAAMLRDTAEPPALPLTFPSEDPTCKIDYLFVSDSVIAHNVTVPDTQQSDHRPYFAEIEI